MLPIAFPVAGPARVRDTWTNSRPEYRRDAQGRTVRTGGTREHRGIDIVAPRGTPIVSATPGTIVRIWNANQGRPQGNSIQIQDPDGEYHLYAHMDAPPDPQIVGWTVRPGQFIGRVGMTGSADGPHLHYQIERIPGNRDSRVNPYTRLAHLFQDAEAARVRAAMALIPGAARGGRVIVEEHASNRRRRGGRVGDATPTAPTITISREMAEEAREAVRGLLPSVERGLERLADGSWQSRLVELVGRERAELTRTQTRNFLAVANTFLGMIRENIRNAEAFPTDRWALWYPTWLMLDSVARGMISIGDPLRSSAAARDGVVGVLLTQLANVRDIYDDVRRSLDSYVASAQETIDDVHEAPADLTRAVQAAIPELPSSGSIFAGIAITALALGLGFGLFK